MRRPQTAPAPQPPPSPAATPGAPTPDPTAPPETASLEEVFERASRQLLAQHPGDERGRMLRSAGLKTAGRFYAFTTRDELTVKLPAARVSALIAAGVGRPCDPRGGRPMREWVQLTPADEAACAAYLAEARAFVAGQRV